MYRRIFIGRGIDGLLLIGTARPETACTLLKQRSVSIVIAWRYPKHSVYPNVDFENRASAEKIYNSVLEFGHRKIATISSIAEGNNRAADRIRGERKALRSADLTLGSSYLIEASYKLESTNAAMEKLTTLVPRATAVICGNDVLAAGAKMFANHTGMSVPFDVCVVGFG